MNELMDMTKFSLGFVSSIIIIVVLSLVMIVVGLKVKRLHPSEVPSGFTLLSITFVEMVNGMIEETYKDKWKPYAPLLLTVLIFLLFANTVAIFGLTPPLTSINVALSLGFFAFICIQIIGYTVTNPFKRAASMLNPLNLIGEISTPLAMGLRLFGNLLSGTIIGIIIFVGGLELSKAIFNALGGNLLGAVGFSVAQFLGLSIGAFIHAVFDIFFGAIQAYVYFMLFTIFLSMAIED